MPPKRNKEMEAQMSAKNAQKASDKTFGLKNKNKSKAVQKYIQSVQQGAGIKPTNKEAAEKADDKKKGAAAAQQAALMSSLFKGLPSVKKAEERAAKEKEAKKQKEEAAKLAAKADVSEEMKRLRRCFDKLLRDFPNGIIISAVKNMIRQLENIGFEVREKEDFGFEKFQDLLRSPQLEPETLKLETKPNGTICIRPPWWKKAEDEEDDEIPLEELIEQQRKALSADEMTMTTKENFYDWLKLKKEQRIAQSILEKQKNKKKGGNNGLSGRELFMQDASIFQDAEDAGSDIDYDARDEEADPADVGDAGLFGEDEELPDED